MQASRRHHYIPEFYQKRWTVSGEVTVFQRYGDGVIRARPKAPAASAYEPYLYETPGVSEEQAQHIEDKFFNTIDTDASDALDFLDQVVDVQSIVWPDRLREGWFLFLISLMFRTPEDLARLKDRFKDSWRLSDPDEAQWRAWERGIVLSEADLEEYRNPDLIEREALETFKYLIKSKLVNKVYGSLPCVIRPFEGTVDELLTSDRPLVQTNGLENGYIMLPIGPRRLFIAAPDPETIRSLGTIPDDTLVKSVNEIVVRHAKKYVFGTDERQLELVTERMGTWEYPSFIDNLGRPF